MQHKFMLNSISDCHAIGIMQYVSVSIMQCVIEMWCTHEITWEYFAAYECTAMCDRV